MERSHSALEKVPLRRSHRDAAARFWSLWHHRSFTAETHQLDEPASADISHCCQSRSIGIRYRRKWARLLERHCRPSNCSGDSACEFDRDINSRRVENSTLYSCGLSRIRCVLRGRVSTEVGLARLGGCLVACNHKSCRTAASGKPCFDIGLELFCPKRHKSTKGATHYCWQWIYTVSLVGSAVSLTTVPHSPWLATTVIGVSSIAWLFGATQNLHGLTPAKPIPASGESVVLGQLLGLLSLGLAVHALEPTFFVTEGQWRRGSAFWRCVAIAVGYTSIWHLLRLGAGKVELLRGTIASLSNGIANVTTWTGASIGMALSGGTLLVAGIKYASGDLTSNSAIERGWIQFEWTPVLALILTSFALAMQVADRGGSRFAESLRKASVFLLLILHALTIWLAIAFIPANALLTAVTLTSMLLAIAIAFALRRAALKGVLFAGSLERSLWPTNLLALAVSVGFPVFVLSVWGIWRPLTTGER